MVECLLGVQIKERLMVIRTIGINHIRQQATSRHLTRVKGVASMNRIGHSPQDPNEHRRRRGREACFSIREQIQQEELATLRMLQCDVRLLTGELDHDIAILNIVV